MTASRLALDIAAQVRAARIAKGWTQEDMASITGLSRYTVMDAENPKSKRGPSLTTVYYLFLALGLTLEVRAAG